MTPWRCPNTKRLIRSSVSQYVMRSLVELGKDRRMPGNKKKARIEASLMVLMDFSSRITFSPRTF